MRIDPGDSRTLTRSQIVALMVAHCAGMIDLVSLPVWVGTLISKYGFDAQKSGGLATMFLLSAVAASVGLAPRVTRLRARVVATAGFMGAALAFAAVALTQRYAVIAGLHALAGVGAGAALSVTHGAMGRSARPHQLFAIAGLSLGVMGVIVLGVTPPLVEAFGGALLFRLFAGIMLVGAVVSVVAFPDFRPEASQEGHGIGRVPRAVWSGIFGVSAMALVQAMVFSFVERMGHDRGFGLAATTGVLIATGFVALLPAPVAALLERRVSARTVTRYGPIVQAGTALIIATATTLASYAVASAAYVSIMIFTHTFAFGLLARLDPSGRAVAGTPAMLMTGAAVGPILGGTLVLMWGYPALGLMAVIVDGVACFFFWRLRAVE